MNCYCCNSNDISELLIIMFPIILNLDGKNFLIIGLYISVIIVDLLLIYHLYQVNLNDFYKNYFIKKRKKYFTRILILDLDLI